MCMIKFFIELHTFSIDDKDLTTNNVSEKSAQTFLMDDASVSHPSVYISFLDGSPVSSAWKALILEYYSFLIILML